MNKLISFARITEVDAFSDRIIAFFEGEAALQNDAFLQKTFGSIKKLSDEITVSIKRTRTKSTLAQADARRCDKFRALAKIIEGYAANPLDELRVAGTALKKIFDKYGLKTLTESFFSKSSLIESLLLDLKKPKAEQAAAKLLGVAEAIAELRAAEDNFDDEMILYDKARVREKSEVSATEVKKNLVQLINEKLVPYLSAMTGADEKPFADFARRVEIEINKVNRAVRGRLVD